MRRSRDSGGHSTLLPERWSHLSGEESQCEKVEGLLKGLLVCSNLYRTLSLPIYVPRRITDAPPVPFRVIYSIPKRIAGNNHGFLYDLDIIFPEYYLIVYFFIITYVDKTCSLG